MYGVTRLHLLAGALLVVSRGILASSSEETSSNFETVHTSNAAILNRLGLAPLQIPDGHHKKRLAGPEPLGLSGMSRIHQPYSRRHGHRDSHVYIVKLPASPPYYTITKPHKSAKDDKVTKTGPNFPVGFHSNGKPAKIYHWNLPVMKKITEKKRLQAQIRMDQAKKRLEEAKKHLHQQKEHHQQQQQQQHQQQQHQQQQQHLSSSPVTKSTLDKNQFTTITVKKTHETTDGKQYHGMENGFQAHQKSPVVKHVRNNDKRLSYPAIAEKKSDAGKKVGSAGASNKNYRLDDSSVHRIHLTNELHGSRNTAQKVKKHRKKAAMSYYAPIATKTGSTSIHKNFPGNGKLKAFYVMEKSRKPVYYHPLLP